MIRLVWLLFCLLLGAASVVLVAGVLIAGVLPTLSCCFWRLWFVTHAGILRVRRMWTFCRQRDAPQVIVSVLYATTCACCSSSTSLRNYALFICQIGCGRRGRCSYHQKNWLPMHLSRKKSVFVFFLHYRCPAFLTGLPRLSPWTTVSRSPYIFFQ